MNVFNNWITNRLTEGLKKRVFKFIIKKALGRFIHEPDLSQLDVELSKGHYSLSNVSLNVKGINEHLRDVPFVLKSGYIEEIKVKIPFNILSENLHIEVNGFELNFRLKETMNHVDRHVLSSLLTESFIGERGDPSVLASSILVGDVRKSDLESEFEDDDDYVETSKNEELGEAEGIIAQLIERVVSSLKATVTSVTVRFEFPSELKPKKNNVLLVHFPKLEYADNTPMPTGNDSWYPSVFIYSFLFNGFFIQLFDEDADDKHADSMHHSTSSIYNDSQQTSENNSERLLDDGNTIIYGRAENNMIRIKILTPDNNKKMKKMEPHQTGGRIEIQFNISSIHSVFTPSQLKMLVEIMESMSKTMTTASNQNEYGNTSTEMKMQPTTQQQFNELSRRSIMHTSMTQSIHESMFQSFNNSGPKVEKLTATMIDNMMQSSHVTEPIDSPQFFEMPSSLHSDNANMHIADSLFKPIDEYDSDEGSFYSINSNEGDGTTDAKQPKMDDVPLRRFRSSFDDFSALESTPVSLQIMVKLQGATFNLLYEDTNLTPMWKKFRSCTHLSHGEGPNVTVNHLALRCTDLVVKSDNNNDKNCIEVGIGNLSIYERLRKNQSPIPKSSSQVFNLSDSIMDDYLSEKKPKKSARKLEFTEQKILEFIPRAKSPSEKEAPHIALIIDFNRLSNMMEVSARMDPLKLSLEAGIVERLVALIKDIRRSRKRTHKQKTIRTPADSVDMIDDFDSEVQPFTSMYELDMDFVQIEISFPENENKKHDYVDNVIRCELTKMKWKSDKIQQDTDTIILSSKIDKLAVFLLNLKNKSKPEPIVDTFPLSLTLISRKKSQNQDSIYDTKSTSTVRHHVTDFDSDSDVDLQTSSSSTSGDDLFEDQYTSEEPATPLETIEVIVSDEKAFKSANTALLVSSSKVDVALTREEFVLIQQLLQFFMKEVTAPLDKLSELIKQEENDDVVDQIKSEALQSPTSARTTLQNMLFDTDRNDSNPDTAVKISLKQLTFKMKQPVNADIPPDNCTLTVNDMSGFVMMYPESKMRVNLKAEDLSLLHSLFDQVTKKEKQYEILRKSNRLVRDFRENTSAFLLNMIMKQPEPNFQKILVHMQTNGLYLKHYFYEENKDWISLVSNFFQSDVQYEGELVTSVTMTLQDTVVDYSPVNLPSRFLLLVSKIRLSTQMIQSADDMTVSVEVSGIYGLLHASFKRDVLGYLRKHNMHSELGFLADLKNLRFAQILTLNNLEVVAKLLNAMAKPSREKPPVFIEISNGTVTVDLCSDSLNTLIELASYLGANGDVAPSVNKPSALPLDNMQDNNEFSIQLLNPDFMTHIDENAFSPNNQRQNSSFGIYPSVNGRDIKPSSDTGRSEQRSSTKLTTVNHSSVIEDLEADDSVRVYSNFNMSRIQDYFPLTHNDDNTVNRLLPPSYPIPQMEILLRNEVNAVISLNGGKDWGSADQQRSTRDTTQSVQINLMECFIQFHTFNPIDEYLWRAKISIRDIDVLDRVKTSNRNKIFCYWNSSQFPREDGSRMLDFVFECVQPASSRQEMRSDLSLLPMRINLHQHTLYFLLGFFGVNITPTIDDQEGLTDKKESPPNSPGRSQDAPGQMFFQTFKTSELVFCIDYQPTQVDYTSLKQGAKIEFLNFIPLNEVEVRLSPLNLRGIYGVDRMISSVTESWMPDIYGTKTFKLLLGIMPIRSLYNVGSGVADLFLLPIQQYNKDGRVLRGIRQGITSFVTHTSVESVSLSANAASGISYVIGAVSDYLAPGTSHASSSRTNDIPATSISEGLQKAYHNLNENYEDAKYAILAIPNDEGGATLGTLKAIPKFVLSPLVGVTSAASNVLSAIEASIRPKEDSSDVFKQPGNRL